MSPRIALSAVVFPAPLGPMMPTIRPSSKRKLMESSAMVLPNALRRPRASMHAMALAVLLWRWRLGGFRLGAIRRRKQFFRLQAQPLNGRVDPGPFFAKEL